MGFPLGTAIKYDPHQVISKIRQENNNNPFEHTEVYGLKEATNWEDYPDKAPDMLAWDTTLYLPYLEIILLKWIFLV